MEIRGNRMSRVNQDADQHTVLLKIHTEELVDDINDLIEEHTHVRNINTEIQQNQRQVGENTHSFVRQSSTHISVDSLTRVQGSSREIVGSEDRRNEDRNDQKDGANNSTLIIL